MQHGTGMEVSDIEETSNTLYTATPLCDNSSDTDTESEKCVIFIKSAVRTTGQDLL
jgi:hypothetical protein